MILAQTCFSIPDDAVDRRKLGKLNYRSISGLTRFIRLTLKRSVSYNGRFLWNLSPENIREINTKVNVFESLDLVDFYSLTSN